MTTQVSRTLIVPYPASDMYALVDDIAAYPDFLPWCESADVSREGGCVCARLGIYYRGFRTAFATRNTHTPDSHIQMELADGPLSSLSGTWEFIPIEDNRCRIEFNLQYELKNALMAAALAKLFSFIFDHFVEHFINRAHQCHRAIRVEIVQAADAGADAKTLQLPPDATVADALAAANLPYSNAVSVFGRLCAKDTPLADGDRIEINLPLPASPQQQRRQRQ